MLHKAAMTLPGIKRVTDLQLREDYGVILLFNDAHQEGEDVVVRGWDPRDGSNVEITGWRSSWHGNQSVAWIAQGTPLVTLGAKVGRLMDDGVRLADSEDSIFYVQAGHDPNLKVMV